MSAEPVVVCVEGEVVKVEELEPVTASDRGVATDGVILVGNPNDDDDVESFSGVGLFTNSKLFGWLFTINDHNEIKSKFARVCTMQWYGSCQHLGISAIKRHLVAISYLLATPP